MSISAKEFLGGEEAKTVSTQSSLSIPPKEERKILFDNTIIPSFQGNPTLNKIRESYLSRVGKTYESAGQEIIKGVQAGAEDIQKGDIAKGITKSALRPAGEFARAVFAPFSEAIGMGLEKLGELMPETKEKIKSTVQGISDKISNSPALQEFAMKHPEAEKDFQRAMNLILATEITTNEPVFPEIGAGVESVAGKALSTIEKAGGLIKRGAELPYSLSVPMQESTKIALQAYQASQPTLWERVKNFGGKEVDTRPITEKETAVRKGLVGTEWQLGVQAKRTNQEIWSKIIEPQLDAIKDKVNMPSFFEELKNEIISKNADLGRRNTLLEALDSFKEDFSKVNQVGLKKLQAYKEGWAKFLPERIYKGKPIAGAFNEIKNMASEKARKILYSSLGDEVKQAYIDYGNLKSLEEAGRKSIDQLRTKSMSRQIWEEIVDKGITPVATITGQVLYKTGEGLEFIGREGAKKIKDIIENPKAGMSIEDVSGKTEKSLATPDPLTAEADKYIAKYPNDIKKATEEFVNNKINAFRGNVYQMNELGQSKNIHGIGIEEALPSMFGDMKGRRLDNLNKMIERDEKELKILEQKKAEGKIYGSLRVEKEQLDFKKSDREKLLKEISDDKQLLQETKDLGLIWLTPQKEVAEKYANSLSKLDKGLLGERPSPTPNIDEVFLQPKKIFDLTKLTDEYGRIDEYKNYASIDAISKEIGLDIDSLPDFPSNAYELFRGKNAKIVVDALKNQGYDMAILREGNDLNQVIFDKSIVKTTSQLTDFIKQRFEDNKKTK